LPAESPSPFNKHAAVPVGAVYLRRTGETEITAFNTSCPHAGCFVDYMPARNHFWCPCHNSAFSLDGAIETPSSPAARPLDTLEVEIRNQTEVWVKFQNFRMGTAEKIPV
jgi:menaquinol-cytochrome c reductase iron-sulfur subunit